MRLEHFALQVPEPVAMGEWYVKNLGCSVARASSAANPGLFLQAGTVLIEIYSNNKIPAPDYHSLPPSNLHLAFSSANVKADRDRLVKAGAKIADDYFTNPDGDELAMLRDPWGVPLQLVKRAKPMLA
jgi:hypothetical protein